MELFLYSNGYVSSQWMDEFTNLANTTISEFHHFLENASKGWESDLDWWVSSFPSRNTFASPLYYNLCALS